MIKPAALLAHLTAQVKSLKAHPEKLNVQVERGRVAHHLTGAGLGFQYAYTLALLITDYDDHVDTLVLPILAWLSEHQPDLLIDTDRASSAIQIEAEVLDKDRADIRLTLELTESVRVTPLKGGKYRADHLPEPALDALTGANPWRIFLAGEEITG